MTEETHDETIEALDDLLDREKQALLDGDLDQVARLLELKENLIDRLAETEATSLDALTTLNTKLQRNQTLLDQALDGIRSVARRLAALRRVRTSLETYDESGARKKIDMGGETSVEKRA